MVFRCVMAAACFWGSSNAPEAAEPKLPSGCHSISKVENAITGELPANYDAWRRIRKFDIVCYGEIVDIRAPLLSFGGDVLIIADVLELHEAIDTRVMISHDEFDQFENDYKLPDGDIATKIVNGGDEVYYRSYLDYYRSCADCYRMDGALFIPRMPDGLTAAQVGLLADKSKWFRPSFPAPDAQLDRSVLRSGDIRIFAREIRTPAGAPEQVPLPASCPSAYPDRREKLKLIASGLNAGRGGAGGPAKCSGALGGGGKFGCVDEGYLWTSSGAAPGRPGDGGTIVIRSTASPAQSESLRQRLAPLSSVDPGRKQSTGAFLAPQGSKDAPGLALSHKSTGSICDFFQPDRQTGTFPDVASGANGQSALTPANRRAALSEFLETIITKETWAGYDLAYHATEPKIRSFRYLTFYDFLTARNVDYISFAYDRLTSDIYDVFIEDRFNRSAYAARFLSGDAIDPTLLTRLPPRVSSSFFELDNFTDEGGQQFETSLARVGGLFNLGAVTNRQILAAEQATQLLSRVQEQLSDIQATLVNIDLTTTEQLYLTRRAELNSQAGALQAALQALKERAQAEQVGSPQFFAGLTETGAQVGKGVTTISAETVNLEGYARGVGDIGAGVIRFFDILRVEDFGPQISKIQADLEAVRRAIADLENSIARERERIHGQAMDALASRYNARLQSIRIRQQRAFLGADMLRLAIISHFSNPARHVNDLRINLNGARNHLSGGEEPGFFKWRDIVGQCSEPGGYSVEECFEAGPFNERHLVVYDYPVGNTTIAVPLYSLAATYRKFRLPTYGLRVRLTKDTVQQFEPLLPF